MAGLEAPDSTETEESSTSGSHDQSETEANMRPSDKRFERWRHTIGLILLALVVFSWTATNFLASSVLADKSFSKPFFVSYLNTSFFIIPLVPALILREYRNPGELKEWVDECIGWMKNFYALFRSRRREHRRYKSKTTLRVGRRLDEVSQARLLDDSMESAERQSSNDNNLRTGKNQVSLSETAKLGAQFSPLWFLASYLLLACLEHTTVASSTILTSTSSIFTLAFGAMTGVETFTIRKLVGVLASLAGVILISLVDYSGQSSDDEHRGDFPEKSTGELALGNTLALLSAIVYGIYTIFMKKRIADESKVNMPIFFGFVGLTNVLLLWPGFFLLHWSGWETFKLPSSGRVTLIVLLNATGSMVSDVIWAYAVLLTSPILVTVGLSLNIPLSLVGQMVLNSQRSTGLYWIGAIIVVLSFVIVN